MSGIHLEENMGFKEKEGMFFVSKVVAKSLFDR